MEEGKRSLAKMKERRMKEEVMMHDHTQGSQSRDSESDRFSLDRIET